MVAKEAMANMVAMVKEAVAATDDGGYGYKGQKGLDGYWEDDEWERQNRGWSQQRRQDWRPEWVELRNEERAALRNGEETAALLLNARNEESSSQRNGEETAALLFNAETELRAVQKTEEQSEQRRRATKGKLYRAEQHEKAVREELAAAELMKEGLETGESRVQEELLAADFGRGAFAGGATSCRRHEAGLAGEAGATAETADAESCECLAPVGASPDFQLGIDLAPAR